MAQGGRFTRHSRRRAGRGDHRAEARRHGAGHPGHRRGRLRRACFWLVDPLDGTKEFIRRNGEFTVNIALVEGDRAVLGVVHVPSQGVTYAAAGSATRQRGSEAPQPIMARPVPARGAIVVHSTVVRMATGNGLPNTSPRCPTPSVGSPAARSNSAYLPRGRPTSTHASGQRRNGIPPRAKRYWKRRVAG